MFEIVGFAQDDAAKVEANTELAFSNAISVGVNTQYYLTRFINSNGRYLGAHAAYTRVLSKKKHFVSFAANAELEYYRIKYKNDYSFGSVIYEDEEGLLCKAGLVTYFGNWFVKPLVGLSTLLGVNDSGGPKPIWMGLETKGGLAFHISSRFAIQLEHVFRFAHINTASLRNAIRFDKNLLRLNLNYAF
jgi:hypothetical protein